MFTIFSLLHNPSDQDNSLQEAQLSLQCPGSPLLSPILLAHTPAIRLNPGLLNCPQSICPFLKQQKLQGTLWSFPTCDVFPLSPQVEGPSFSPHLPQHLINYSLHTPHLCGLVPLQTYLFIVAASPPLIHCPSVSLSP